MNMLRNSWKLLNGYLLLITFLGLVTSATSTYSQIPAAPSTAAATTQNATGEVVFDPQKVEEDIKAKLIELSKEIEISQKSLEVVSATPPTEAFTQLTRHVELLQKIELIQNQQVSAIQQIKSQNEKKKQLSDDLEKEKNSVPLEQSSYLDLDQTRDELLAEQNRKESIETRINSAQTALEQAQKSFNEKEAIRRQAKETLDQATDETAKQSLTLQLKTAQLESRSAAETVQLREFDVRNERLGRSIYQMQVELLSLRVEHLQGHAVFTEEKLQEQFQRLDKEKFELERSLKKIITDKDTAEKRLAVVRAKQAQSLEADPVLTEEVLARSLEYDALQVKFEMLNVRLDRLVKRREAWQRRFTTINQGADINTLKDWSKETAELIDSLNQQESTIRLRLGDRQNELVTLQNKIDNSADVGQPIKDWYERQRKQLLDLSGSLQDNLANIELARRVFTKLLNEIQSDTSHLTFSQRYDELLKSLDTIWNKEIYVYKDGEIEKPYYVKTIFLAVFFFVLGYFVSRITSRVIGKILRSRLKIIEGASTTIESIIYYFLLILFSLITLSILNVPLTMFTVFGGVFAIAIGFGSQNIMSNFISGVILLVERPVRVGDLVEVEGIFGQVARMGARCTHIRTFTNQDIIVPNSSFLQNKFTNWTLRNRVIRSDIKVGVSYEADSELVQKLLLEIANNHEEILKEPVPDCFFLDFGDSALNFEIRYWVNMATSNRLKIDSQIRHTILKRFRQEGIGIAYPQMDVHLYPQKPLDINRGGPIE